MWRQLTARHPQLNNPTGTFTLRPSGLKALIDQAYEMGMIEGVSAQRKATNPKAVYGDILERMFKK